MVKNIGAYIVILIFAILLYLFFFQPELFYHLLSYKGPGGPFVHPPAY